MKTTRRAILSAGAGVLLPMGRVAAEGPSPMPRGDLSQLLSRRGEIARLGARANTAADALMFAIDRGEPQALARAGELSDLRRAEDGANTALTALDDQIAAFPSGELDEVLMKLRLFAHEQGYLVAAEDGADPSYEVRLLLSIIRDLERLVGARAP